MNRTALILFLSALAGAAYAPDATADQVYLDATFDDKTVDAPIGTGGAAVGEPVNVDATVTATVRSGPFATPCLEIQDNDDFSAGTVRFEFLDSAEISSGLVVIITDLYFFELSQGWAFTLYVREQEHSASSFLTMNFSDNGSVSATDAGGAVGTIGSFLAGQTLPVLIAFDMDAGTYDIYLNGAQVVFNEPHGVTGNGIGSVLLGCGSDADLLGKFAVDQVRVQDYLPPVAVEPATWGRIKALFRP